VLARAHKGPPFWLLVLVEEWTRECMLIKMAPQVGSDARLERHSWLVASLGRPDHVRSGNANATLLSSGTGEDRKVGVKDRAWQPLGRTAHWSA
jgi:hypothetical protein